MQTISKPKNQHWVPRFYLKHFCDPNTKNSKNPQVWVFHKIKREVKKIGIEGFATSRYLYSPKDRTGNRDWSLEEKFASLESHLSQIWDGLIEQKIDLYGWEALRKSIALFVSLLILRHPDNIELSHSLHSKFVELFDSLPKDKNGNPVCDGISVNGEFRPMNTSDFAEYKNPGLDNIQRMFVDGINTGATELAFKLLEKRWSVLFSEEPIFMTSDKPVIIQNEKTDFTGVGTPGAILVFPMSPKKVLMMDDLHDQPKGRYYPIHNNDASPINLLLLQSATRFVVCHRKIDFTNDIMKFTESYIHSRKKWGIVPDLLQSIIFNFKRLQGIVSKWRR